jgi:hypothetical protein
MAENTNLHVPEIRTNSLPLDMPFSYLSPATIKNKVDKNHDD